MPAKTRVVVDASSRMLYASYYVQGLYELFGKENVSFSGLGFSGLARRETAFAFEHYFAFLIVPENGPAKKIVVDFSDSTDIAIPAWNWCDVYAKINVDLHEVPLELLEKMLLVPPGFGIRIWDLPTTLFHAFPNLVRMRLRPIVSLKRHFLDYYMQFKRRKLEDYLKKDGQKNPSDSPYVFMIGTLWGENGRRTNLERKAFIERISGSCTFEGGFLASDENKDNAEFVGYLFDKPYSVNDYVKLTKRSDFVFNTPAVHGCHGWKLPEFLAMGKCIVSTPLSHELPEKLVHGENFHVLSNQNDLDFIIGNASYREKLEANARSYFGKNMTPLSVVKKIVDFGKDKTHRAKCVEE